MAGIIETIFESGQTLYSVIRGGGQMWNPALNAGAGGWENFNAAHWAQYAIPLVEQGTVGYYSAAYPAGITGILTTETIYQQAGGGPATTDGPGIAIEQTQGTNIAAIGGDATGPAKLAANLSTMAIGTVQAAPAPTSTVFGTDLPGAVDDDYLSRAIYFVTGALAGQFAPISGYTAAGAIVTVSAPFTGAPANGDTFVLV